MLIGQKVRTCLPSVDFPWIWHLHCGDPGQRVMQRALAPGVSGPSALARWLLSCLLRSRSRKRPVWCPSLTRLTRLWLSSPEVPSLRPPLDQSMSIGLLKVSSLGPLSRAGGHLFPSIIGHTWASRGTCPLPQGRNSCGHISWKGVPDISGWYGLNRLPEMEVGTGP